MRGVSATVRAGAAARSLARLVGEGAILRRRVAHDLHAAEPSLEIPLLALLGVGREEDHCRVVQRDLASGVS